MDMSARRVRWQLATAGSADIGSRRRCHQSAARPGGWPVLEEHIRPSRLEHAPGHLGEHRRRIAHRAQHENATTASSHPSGGQIFGGGVDDVDAPARAATRSIAAPSRYLRIAASGAASVRCVTDCG